MPTTAPTTAPENAESRAKVALKIKLAHEAEVRGALITGSTKSTNLTVVVGRDHLQTALGNAAEEFITTAIKPKKGKPSKLLLKFNRVALLKALIQSAPVGE